MDWTEVQIKLVIRLDLYYKSYQFFDCIMLARDNDISLPKYSFHASITYG